MPAAVESARKQVNPAIENPRKIAAAHLTDGGRKLPGSTPVGTFLAFRAPCFGSLNVDIASDAALAGQKAIGGTWWDKSTPSSMSMPKPRPTRNAPLSYANIVAKDQTCPPCPSVSSAPSVSKNGVHKKPKSIIDCLLHEATTKERTQESHNLWGKFLPCIENGLLNGAKQKYIRRGLRNNANLCYLNAVIQALLPCSALMQLLSNCSQDPERPFTTMLWRVCKEFNDPKNRGAAPANGTAGEPFSVIMLGPVNDILNTWQTFGTQQDAGEFMFYILNGTHDECKWKANEVLPTIERKMSSETDDGANWNEVGKSNRKVEVRSSGLKEDSPIQRIFGGVLRSVVRGKNAKADSVTLELFTQLSLDISAPSVTSVQDALAHLCSVEQIDSKTKRNTFQQLPPLLILNIKRFTFDMQGGVQKIKKALRYDEKMKFDASLLAAEAPPDTGSLEYTLMAVICHHGERADVGHYNALVRYNDSWFMYDDANVRAIALSEVTNQQYVAYLLLYQSNAPKVYIRP
eukprot:GEMP01015935.1.p1 GENE.GEMP01015935.1~~GEMP01015935.1.p1  ORF type:complete len:518 (+),score=126.17 GEMP01015935.1:92-1645(+)